MRRNSIRPTRLATTILLLAGLATPAAPEALAPTTALPAFPGAEGFGATTVGGRGGEVIHVTHTGDDGPGSLRACLEASGPRICVFRVGGTITLDGEIEIHEPYLTVAGQTAPGDGILIRTVPSTAEAPIKIQTHDVIVRYLRIRTGSATVAGDSHRALSMFEDGGDVYNVVVDHCSMSWGSDELVNAWYDAHDITFQWNIVTDSFDCSNHPNSDPDGDGDCDHGHSKGLLMGSAGSHSYSIHHNLFAHHSERNPRLTTEGVADVVNNVIYNPRFSGSQIDNRENEPGVPARANWVGNHMTPGVDSTSDFLLSLDDTGDAGYEIYLRDNISPSRPDESGPQEDACKQRDTADDWLVDERHRAPPVTTYPCRSSADCEAYDRVVAGAGARAPRLDAVDRRVLAELAAGGGRIIDAESPTTCYFVCDPAKTLLPADYTIHGIDDPLDAEGFPILASGTPYPDDDGDGMSDRWERRHGLDPGIDDSADLDLHWGYTNLDVFLDDVARSR